MERETRLKEEREPNESQKILKKNHLEPRLGNITEKTPKHFKRKPENTVKWSQKWSQNGPGGAPDTNKKPENSLYHFGSPKTSKMDPETDPNIIKSKFGDLHFQAKKT